MSLWNVPAALPPLLMELQVPKAPPKPCNTQENDGLHLKNERKRRFRSKAVLCWRALICSAATAMSHSRLMDVMNYPPINQNLHIQGFMKMNLNKCPGNRRDKPEICSHFYPARTCHSRAGDGGEAIPKVRTFFLLFSTCPGP